MGKTFRMTDLEMNERKQQNVLKEVKLDDIGQWKGCPRSRTSPCCRSGRKQPALWFTDSETCGFLVSEIGFIRRSHGGCKQLEQDWCSDNRHSDSWRNFSRRSVYSHRKTRGPVFFEETINYYGRGRLVLALMFNELTA